MILRRLRGREPKGNDDSAVRSAWEVFLKSQQGADSPCAMVFQSEHARLAGQLAAALTDDCFGSLPPEAMEAVRRHDSGWDPSDQRQIERLAIESPRPFMAIDCAETLAAWRGSIAHAAEAGPLAEVLVSRHFTLLAAADPARAEFVRGENERRAAIERGLRIPPADLDRWTAALGFCDLLSLYLCCGARTPVDLPLAHPASPDAAIASTVELCWTADSPRLSTPALKTGTEVTASAVSAGGDTLVFCVGFS